MKRERIILFGILVLLSLASISAILTHGNGITIDTSTTTINQTILNNTYYINGSNINASSFSTQCSGTDKVINVTYSNFTGLFTVVCDTDVSGAGGLTWEEIINGTVYLSNNTYGFYNTSTQIWNIIDNGTFLKTFIESDPKAYNGTLAYLSQILS